MKNTILLLTTLALFCISSLTAQTVSKEEALRYGHQLETTINDGDPSMMNHVYDLDKMVKIIMKKSKKLSSDPGFMEGFKSGFTGSLLDAGNQVLVTSKNGSYRLLRSYEKDGEQHLFFRLYGKGGLNYHDFTLTKSGDSIRASDCYIYTTDELLSTTLSKLVDLMTTDATNSGLTEDAQSLVQLTKLYRQGDYAGARTYYDKLPVHIKQAKSIQMINLIIGSKLDQAQYQEDLEQYVSLYPNVSSGYMMMLNLYYLRKESNKGVATVNRLDSLVGIDPFLNFFRGNFYDLAGVKDSALTCYEKAYKSDPDMVLNTAALLVSYGEANQNDKAKIVIAEYRKSRIFKQQTLDNLYKKYPALK